MLTGQPECFQLLIEKWFMRSRLSMELSVRLVKLECSP